MPKLKVNGKEVEFQNGMTVLQACELAGEEIPRFCYHERLKIAGNCRMCLVQIEGGPPKPAASCAMPAVENMSVHTNTPMVKKAREGVMEFLLINHPLDCPICDQGGECDLQDQAMTYGRGKNRFYENKRSVKEKDLGPLIKTFMTRCIHCTRCIRFLDDVAGVEEMGAVYRGEDMEVGTFIEKSISSELSGNIIDLCPVGALTSKPYAFKARSWELKKTESIDVFDAVGCNIRIDSRGNEVMRILPRLHEDINEEWISDKARFSYDGLKTQRLDRPMIRQKGRLVEASWDEAYSAITQRVKDIKGDRIAAIAGDMADAESMFVLKEFITALGSKNIDCRQDGAKLDNNLRSSYIFNTTIAGIEESDFCLLIGTNPRYEAPLINTRLRKRYLDKGFKMYSIGSKSNLTYKINNLGQSLDIIDKIKSEKHKISQEIQGAKKPMVIVGSGVLTRKDGAAILNSIRELCDKFNIVTEEWNGFNVLHTAASRVAGLDIGFLPEKGGKDVAEIMAGVRQDIIEVVYLLGADEIDVASLRKSEIGKGAFIIYQGHHGDVGAHNADVILPGAAYTEKNATYINTEGRVQRTKMAVFPPGKAKEDWAIINELSQKTGFGTGYRDISHLRERMFETLPHFEKEDEIMKEKWGKFGEKAKIGDEPVKETIKNFYMTNSISRASKTMAECSSVFIEKNKEEAA